MHERGAAPRIAQAIYRTKVLSTAHREGPLASVAATDSQSATMPTTHACGTSARSSSRPRSACWRRLPSWRLSNFPWASRACPLAHLSPRRVRDARPAEFRDRRPPFAGGALRSSGRAFKPESRFVPRLGDRSWGQVLGRGLVASRRLRQQKAVCWPSVKPSDGLEPSTPSLPSGCRRAHRAPPGTNTGLSGHEPAAVCPVGPPLLTSDSPLGEPASYA
jgi:hypothetical protein